MPTQTPYCLVMHEYRLRKHGSCNRHSCQLPRPWCDSFLQAEGHSAVEIHRRLCRMYGHNVMSDNSVRDWCMKCKDERAHVYDEGRGGAVKGWHSTMTDELDQISFTRTIQLGDFFLLQPLQTGLHDYHFPSKMNVWLATQRFESSEELMAE